MSNYSSQPLPPEGWYPDPVSGAQERYWNGQGWTDHTRPANTAQVQDAYQAQQPYQTQQPYQAQQTYQGGAYAVGPTTDDGVPLAGWWQRAGALIIDGLVVMVLVMLAAFPFYDDLRVGMEAMMNDMMRAAQAGSSAVPDPYDPRYGLNGPIMAINLINIGIALVYSIGLQMSKGATLGMMALGLRVVPTGRGREHNGLDLATALKRNIVYQLLGYIALVQVVNVAMPLFNAKRQAIHDMAGRTQVVKIR